MDFISTIISIVLGIAAILGGILALYKWILYKDINDSKQKDDIEELKQALNNYKQTVDDKITDMNAENMVIIYGLISCLDGLKQLGANGNVTAAHESLEQHLNNRAHGK